MRQQHEEFIRLAGTAADPIGASTGDDTFSCPHKCAAGTTLGDGVTCCEAPNQWQVDLGVFGTVTLTYTSGEVWESEEFDIICSAGDTTYKWRLTVASKTSATLELIQVSDGGCGQICIEYQLCCQFLCTCTNVLELSEFDTSNFISDGNDLARKVCLKPVEASLPEFCVDTPEDWPAELDVTISGASGSPTGCDCTEWDGSYSLPLEFVAWNMARYSVDPGWTGCTSTSPELIVEIESAGTCPYLGPSGFNCGAGSCACARFYIRCDTAGGYTLVARACISDVTTGMTVQFSASGLESSDCCLDSADFPIDFVGDGNSALSTAPSSGDCGLDCNGYGYGNQGGACEAPYFCIYKAVNGEWTYDRDNCPNGCPTCNTDAEVNANHDATGYADGAELWIPCSVEY